MIKSISSGVVIIAFNNPFLTRHREAVCNDLESLCRVHFFYGVMMSQEVERFLLVLLQNVREDISDLRNRLTALERSHRSLCNSHEELEGFHKSLQGSLEVVLRGTLQTLEDTLRCISGCDLPEYPRLVVHSSDHKSVVDGTAA